MRSQVLGLRSQENLCALDSPYLRQPFLRPDPCDLRYPDLVYPESSMIRFLRPFDPHRIRLLVFDLDGTLIDSRLDLIHSVNAMLQHIGRPELDGDVIASYVGDGAPALVRRAVGDTDDEALFLRALEYFLGYYRRHKLDHTTIYAGMAETLASLASPSPADTSPANPSNGVRRQMAVLSNK